ncbi:MAG: hypothetical protein P8M07_08370 [Flavobacteriales bacterium]|jgi:hypothetical protein|nr:hypothetical protein [Flavobacteriales bacterium]
MKKLLFTLLTCSFAFSAIAQDATQPKGTWYLGTADATQVFNLFSSNGMEVSPFVGYAVADNIAITVGLDYASMTTEVEGGDDQEMSASNITIGGAYFFGDDFYAQAGIGLGSSSSTGTDDLSSTQIQIGLGKFIPVKDMWYVSPQFSYGTMSTDGQSGAAASIGISFGARF